MMSQSKQRLFHYDPARAEFTVAGRKVSLPRHKGKRIAIGVALVIGGIFGFLPILGLWMVPVGLLVLSQDFARVRRWRRSASVYLARRSARRNGQDGRRG